MSNESEPTMPPSDGKGTGMDTVNEALPTPPAVPEGKSEKNTDFPDDFPDDFPESEPVANETADQISQSDEEAAQPDQQQEGDSMGFLDHLEELRWRLIRGGIAFIVAAVFCAIFADFLVNDVLIHPLKISSPNIRLQNLVPYGQLSLYFQVVLFSAFILAFPFLVWQVWKFVEPGLHETERSASRFIILFISICFFCGISFGYFVFLPISLTFFAGFGSPLIQNNIAVQDYISFFLGTLLTTGIVFELPFVSYILSKIGLLTPAFMRFYRRHAVITMLITAAIVTPSTDMVTQMVIAIPMLLLYEISIFISGRVQKNRNRQMLRENHS
jgi:sec-independent protein translocase protein TatC